jgi:hypothetical protein
MDIPDGMPRCVFTLPLVSRRRIRCESCAGEPVPVDVPVVAPPARTAVVLDFTPIRQLAGLPLDWRRRSANDERDPGEEG